MKKIQAIIENLLLVSSKPLSIKRIRQVLENEIETEEIKKIMDKLLLEYSNRSIWLEEIALGYRFSTRPEYSQWVKKFLQVERGKKLSPAAIEVLSIIAYRQPVTKAEIDSVRGVDSGGVLRTIFDKKLIKGAGRKKVIGKPLMYGTSARFLEYFGLKSISDLPTLREVELENKKPVAPEIVSQEKLGFPLEEKPQRDPGKEDENPSETQHPECTEHAPPPRENHGELVSGNLMSENGTRKNEKKETE